MAIFHSEIDPPPMPAEAAAIAAALQAWVAAETEQTEQPAEGSRWSMAGRLEAMRLPLTLEALNGDWGGWR